MSVPDLNDLLVFLRVADAGSFTAAARALGLPKSTVSRRVSRLEDRFGVRLLQRTTRKQSLTDAGRTLYDRTAHIMSDLQDAERAVTEFSTLPSGRVRVTAPVEFSAIPQLITDFLHLHQGVQIDLDLTNRYVDLVEEGFDVAIRAGRLPDSTLIARKVGDAHTTLVASPAYLESRGAPQDIEDLTEHDCVIFGSQSRNATWTLSGARGPVKVPVSGRISVNHFDVVRQAAVAGFGIALLPVDWVSGEISAGRLVAVLPGACPPSSPLWAVTPSRKHLSPAVSAFIGYLKARLSDGIG